jgi:hypothetical protein
MSKWWSIIASVGSALLVGFNTTAHNWLILNPEWATIIGGVLVTVAHWLPSPSGAITQAAAANPQAGLVSTIVTAANATATGSHKIS